jgi:hypothetical protein
VSALLAQNAKVHRGPAAKRSPRLRSLLSGAPRPVPVRDLVVEAAFVARQGVRSVGAADDDELGGEGPQPADAPDRGDRLVGVENAQRGTVELPVQRGLGDGAEVLGLPSGQVEVEGTQLLRGRERALIAVPGDEVVPQAGGLGDAHTLGQHRPGSGLVGRVEPARAQPGQLGLGIGDHPVTSGDIGPGASVDVQREEWAT